MENKPRFLVAQGCQANDLRSLLNDYLNDDTKEYRLVAVVSEPAFIDKNVMPENVEQNDKIIRLNGADQNLKQTKKEEVVFHYPIFELK